MAITKNDGRQEVISASVDIAFGDVATGVEAGAIQLPANARVVGGQFDVLTVWNSGTSDVAVISIGSEDVLASTSIAALGANLFDGGQAIKTTAETDVGVTWTGVGAVPSTGAGKLTVLYVVEGRVGFTQG